MEPPINKTDMHNRGRNPPYRWINLGAINAATRLPILLMAKDVPYKLGETFSWSWNLTEKTLCMQLIIPLLKY